MFWSRLKACGMCMQCISVQDDQPTQRLLLKAELMQRALCNMLMTENGTEKLDNELITTLFENITTLAQLHQFTPCWRKKQQKVPPVQKKRHITQQVTVPRFPPEYAPPQLLPVSCQGLSRSAAEELNVRPFFNITILGLDHSTISNLTFRSHFPSVDVFAYDVSTLDQCCVFIVRRRNNHTKSESVVRGWNT